MEWDELKKGMKLTLADGQRVEVLDIDRENCRPDDRVQLERKGTVYLKDLNTGYLSICKWGELRERLALRGIPDRAISKYV